MMVSASLATYAGGANFATSNQWGKPLAYANALRAVGVVQHLTGDHSTALASLPS